MLCLFRGCPKSGCIRLCGSRALTDGGSNSYAAMWPTGPSLGASRFSRLICFGDCLRLIKISTT